MITGDVIDAGCICDQYIKDSAVVQIAETKSLTPPLPKAIEIDCKTCAMCFADCQGVPYCIDNGRPIAETKGCKKYHSLVEVCGSMALAKGNCTDCMYSTMQHNIPICIKRGIAIADATDSCKEWEIGITCETCRHSYLSDKGIPMCGISGVMTHPQDTCSDGEL
jgi:hypothetical protein